MQFIRLLNPSGIYEKRNRIITLLRYHSYHPVRALQRYMARQGCPVTLNERKLLKLKNKHKGQRCFVIGNGPSLHIKDLDMLKNEITFAANKIYLSFDQTDWRPTYYAVEDSLVARQNYPIINQLNGFIKLFPIRMKLWVPSFDNSIYFNLKLEAFYPRKPRFGTNALDRLYWGSTITYTCIQLACFMGIKEIYLIGVDFSFSIPPKRDDKNKKIYVSNGEVNHFHPDYRKPGEKWYEPNLHHQKQSYLAAREAIQRLGGQIFNATHGGKLEIFPRVDFDTLF